eukprot:Nitzschia sp. Nitz4//scaffold347_size17400//13144//14360//NITZ4_008837-RA/size17400-augustus-gene-0.36-mRNA-1//-1//CDS//3329548672//4181//frame0
MAKPEDSNQSCCTWPKIVFAAIALIAAGIVVWQFAPIDSAIDSILPTFNNTGSTPSGSSNNNPTSAPTVAPTAGERFNFMQCADSTSDDCCNGLDGGFCDLPVSEVLFATSHNANADFESGFFISPNHHYKLESSLEAGYRGINVDFCNCGGDIVLCHGTCSLGTRDVAEVFQAVVNFLEENPSEIIVMPLELNSDVDETVDIDEVYSIFQGVTGLVDQIYVHQNRTDDWPTLGELKTMGQRLILFHFNGPTCDEGSECPSGMHYYYRYAVDTQWNLASIDEVNDEETSCTFGQTPGLLSKTFFGLNNFVSVPTQSAAQTMNQYDYIADRMDTCSGLNDDLEVNFVYVNYWSEGDLPQLVQDRNAERAAQRRQSRRQLRRQV